MAHRVKQMSVAWRLADEWALAESRLTHSVTEQLCLGVHICCCCCCYRVCAGGELFEHIGKRAAFTEAAAAEVARSLLQYLAHIHGLGVAHMDIKPENIMFDTQGTDGVLKVRSAACARLQLCNHCASSGTEAATVPAAPFPDCCCVVQPARGS